MPIHFFAEAGFMSSVEGAQVVERSKFFNIFEVLMGFMGHSECRVDISVIVFSKHAFPGNPAALAELEGCV